VGAQPFLDRSLRRTHPLPRGGSDCIQVRRLVAMEFLLHILILKIQIRELISGTKGQLWVMKWPNSAATQQARVLRFGSVDTQ